ncbi:MAG: class I mannose-6-phosphate isomerase [Candidatus Azobacteroides sp.]|nr:class I mannose-6-phosphate isomerase [Candidatus Azobacteroides sp.]
MVLYPLLFNPILKATIWGGNDICRFKRIEPVQDGIGESWEISHVKDNVSVVANGALAGKNLEELINLYGKELIGEKNLKQYGRRFPLLIKFIDARSDLSIQVHPNDELARKRNAGSGKTEMWYVISAAKNSFLYSGFSRKITPEEYIKTVENNTFADTLQKHDIAAGDVFFLPAGRVHAIGKGTFIAEIQQTSDITYRIYDYNRKDAQGRSRELHTESAKDAIDYDMYPEYKTGYQSKRNEMTPLVSCPHFTTNLLEGNKEIVRNFEHTDSFVIYICMEGQFVLTDKNGCQINLKQGNTVLVPASCNSSIKLSLEMNCKILETYIE